MKIKLKELEQILIVITSSLERQGKMSVSLENSDSYYQKIWHEDRDLSGNPPITLGMIDDDMDQLKSLLHGEAVSYSDLERLGAVLTVVGAVLAKK